MQLAPGARLYYCDINRLHIGRDYWFAACAARSASQRFFLAQTGPLLQSFANRSTAAHAASSKVMALTKPRCVIPTRKIDHLGAQFGLSADDRTKLYTLYVRSSHVVLQKVRAYSPADAAWVRC